MNADDIYRALQNRHKLPEWVLIRELRLATGDYRWRQPSLNPPRVNRRWRCDAMQRIDAFAINCYEGKEFMKIAYEIKISHGDFIREKRDPDKRQGALEVADYFYFAAPRGVIAPMELPKGTGLLVVYDSGRSEILERAPRLPATRLDWAFVASLMRNAMMMRRRDLPEDRFEDLR